MYFLSADMTGLCHHKHLIFYSFWWRCKVIFLVVFSDYSLIVCRHTIVLVEWGWFLDLNELISSNHIRGFKKGFCMCKLLSSAHLFSSYFLSHLGAPSFPISCLISCACTSSTVPNGESRHLVFFMPSGSGIKPFNSKRAINSGVFTNPLYQIEEFLYDSEIVGYFFFFYHV